jgi:hypothetical protein
MGFGFIGAQVLGRVAHLAGDIALQVSECNGLFDTVSSLVNSGGGWKSKIEKINGLAKVVGIRGAIDPDATIAVAADFARDVANNVKIKATEAVNRGAQIALEKGAASFKKLTKRNVPAVVTDALAQVDVFKKFGEYIDNHHGDDGGAALERTVEYGLDPTEDKAVEKALAVLAKYSDNTSMFIQPATDVQDRNKDRVYRGAYTGQPMTDLSAFYSWRFTEEFTEEFPGFLSLTNWVKRSIAGDPLCTDDDNLIRPHETGDEWDGALEHKIDLPKMDDSIEPGTIYGRLQLGAATGQIGHFQIRTSDMATGESLHVSVLGTTTFPVRVDVRKLEWIRILQDSSDNNTAWAQLEVYYRLLNVPAERVSFRRMIGGDPYNPDEYEDGKAETNFADLLGQLAYPDEDTIYEATADYQWSLRVARKLSNAITVIRRIVGDRAPNFPPPGMWLYDPDVTWDAALAYMLDLQTLANRVSRSK